MLDTESRYIYEVHHLKSVSKAAEALYISQPALSAAIKRVEQKLGAPIFNRKTLPFSLTPEGKVYVEAVERMLSIEKQTTERIQDIRKTKQGMLRIGTAKYLAYFMIPSVLKTFRQQYPQVDVHLEVAPHSRLYDLLEKERVDMVMLSSDSVPEGYTAVSLLEERLVVVLRRDATEAESLRRWAVSYEELISRRYGDDRLLTDMSVLNGLEFMYSPTNTGIYKKRRLLFNGRELSPHVISNTSNVQLNYNLMLAGVGAFLTTDASVATMPPNNDCMYIVLGGDSARQAFCMVYPAATASAVRDAFITTALARFSEQRGLQNLLSI